MNIKISLLSVMILTAYVGANAQTSRNPLNHEPARISIQKNNSSWKLLDETLYRTTETQLKKYFYVYNDNGQRISEVMQQWDKANEAWQDASKNDYTFSENKNIIVASEKTATGWQNTLKVENFFDSKGKQLYSLNYQWNDDSEDWSLTPTLKCEWVYNRDGQMTEYLKHRMDKKTNEWQNPDTRILYAYDKAGDITEELFQSWNTDNKSWTNGGKYTYSNDNDGNKIAVSYFYASYKWVLDGKIIFIYDNEGKLSRSEYYGSSDNLNIYSLFSYFEKRKTPDIRETEDIDIYPNPVISFFEMTVPKALVGMTATIYNVYGNSVMNIVVNNEKSKIDINGLKEGIYVVKIGDKNKKFIIK